LDARTYFYLTRERGEGFICLLTLGEIHDKLAAGELKKDHYATEFDGRRFAEFKQSGTAHWRTLAALFQEQPVLDALVAQSTGGDRTEPWSSNRERLVRRAEEYMQAHLGEPLSVLDLCRELGVSERTLHYAFQEVRGLSPMAYFQARRLNAVRQELKAAPAGTTTVREIAQRWGFWHTGEFASAYRRLFGELPSQTFNG